MTEKLKIPSMNIQKGCIKYTSIDSQNKKMSFQKYIYIYIMYIVHTHTQTHITIKDQMFIYLSIKQG